MSDATVTTAVDHRHGRNRITSRAIRTVVSAVAARALGAPARTIHVELADADGGLRLIVSAPIGLPPLTTTAGAPSVPTGASVLDRAERARRTVRDEVSRLTGSTIGAVDLRLTSAHIDRDRIDRPRTDRARVDRPQPARRPLGAAPRPDRESS